MTTLISENDRSILGIDTYERAAVWSGFVLIAANLEKGGTARNFSFEADAGMLSFTLNFTLSPQLIAQWAGDVWEAVIPISSTVGYLNNALAPSLGGYPIESPPLEITNLERYFLWVLQTIKKNGILETEPDIIINNRRAVIETTFQIPYSESAYLQNNNYLESLIYWAGNNAILAFGNDLQLTNDYQLIN